MDIGLILGVVGIILTIYFGISQLNFSKEKKAQYQNDKYQL